MMNCFQVLPSNSTCAATPWDELTCGHAAGGGNLEALRWARERGCRWDERTWSFAASGGHLEVLKWARAHECPWDSVTAEFAAYCGHLELLRWAREQHCEWDRRLVHVPLKVGTWRY